MQLFSFIIAFILALFLISKNVNMGLSLIIAAFVTGITYFENLKGLLITILEGMFSSLSIELMIIVGLISGLGYIMKVTGDLDQMLNSLNALLKNIKVLLMVVPALIGTLNIPGGAILSAPMIAESGKKVQLDKVNQNSINLFFRHIGFFIYPLYPTMILTAELLDVSIISIIKYTFFVMLTGIIAAYPVMLKNVKNQQKPKEDGKFIGNVKSFISGFAPIIIILILALLLNIPFHYALFLGVVFALCKKTSKNSVFFTVIKKRIRDFIVIGVDYQLVFTIAGLMAFKNVIEDTGVVNEIAQIIIEFGVPLPFLVCGLGLLAGYVSGVHMAAIGILGPLFAPMLTGGINTAVYAALLFTTINVGYLISPLHLCLVLGNEYFDVDIGPVYRKLSIPLMIMIIFSLIQVYLFA